MTVGAGGVLSALVFGIVTLGSVTSHRERESALVATASWREDFESDLGDSYRFWYADNGGTETWYTGNYYEWWSLDPDRDGQLESDAPILRALDEHGWSARGISILDNDGDAVVDQLQWTGDAVTDSGVWCIPVIQHRGSTNLILADWGSATPTQCG